MAVEYPALRHAGRDIRQPEDADLAGGIPSIFIVVRLIDGQLDQRRSIDTDIHATGTPGAVIHDAVLSEARHRPSQSYTEGLGGAVLVLPVQIGPVLLLATDVDQIAVDACDEFAHLNVAGESSV